MSESRKKPARERAFELFAGSGGKMAVAEIVQHLLAEKYAVKRHQVDTWKARDKWLDKLKEGGGKALDPVEFTRMMLGPKLTMLDEERRIDQLCTAQTDVLELTTGISGKLKQRLNDMKPEEIGLKDVPALAETIAKLWALFVAIDREVTERRGLTAKDITPDPDAPPREGGQTLTPLAERALEWERERKGKK